jgi:hypothetical protein
MTTARDAGRTPTAGPRRLAAAGLPRTPLSSVVFSAILRLLVMTAAAVAGYLMFAMFATSAQAASGASRSDGGAGLGVVRDAASLLVPGPDPAKRETAESAALAKPTTRLDPSADSRPDRRPASSAPGKAATDFMDAATRPVVTLAAPVAKAAAPLGDAVAPVTAAKKILAPVEQAVTPVTTVAKKILAPVEAVAAPITQPVGRVLNPIVSPVAPGLPIVGPVAVLPPVDSATLPAPTPVGPRAPDGARPSERAGGPAVVSPAAVAPPDGQANPAVGPRPGPRWPGCSFGRATPTLRSPQRPAGPGQLDPGQPGPGQPGPGQPGPGQPGPWATGQSQSPSLNRAGGADGPAGAAPDNRRHLPQLDAFHVVHSADDRGAGRSPGVLDVPG